MMLTRLLIFDYCTLYVLCCVSAGDVTDNDLSDPNYISCHTELEQLRSEVMDARSEFTEYMREMTYRFQQLDDLHQEQLADIQLDFVDKLATAQSQCDEQVKLLDKKIMDTVHEVPAQPDVIAFSARRDYEPFESIGPNPMAQILQFDRVQYVLGPGYDVDSSTFTAPITGLYMFAFSTQNGVEGYSIVNLMVNDDTVRSSRTDGIHVSGHQMALLQLYLGDRVSVQLPPEHVVYCYRCYFDGYLLTQLN